MEDGKMQDTMKYQSRALFGGVLAIIIALLTFALNYKYMIHGQPENLNKLLYENKYELDSKDILNKDVISLTVNSSLGAFATESHRVYGIPMGTDTLYVVLLDDNSVMAVQLKKQSDIDKMEKIVSETYASKDYYASTSLTIDGKVGKLSDPDLEKYFNKALEDLGIKGNDKNEIKIRYITLDATRNRGYLWMVTILFLFGGLALLFGETFISMIENRANKKMLATAERANNESAERAPDDNFDFMDIGSFEKISNNSYLGEDTIMDPNKPEEEERFGTPNRRERTEDNKISISGRNLIK